MSYEFRLPELGENIASAGVVSVLVEEGQTIPAQAAVLEIETDKATLEVPCPVGGKVTAVLAKVGEKAQVGQIVLVIEEAQVTSSTPAPSPVAVAAGQPEEPKEVRSPVVMGNQVVDVVTPNVGENIASVKILNILVKVGDHVQNGGPVAEVETDKATFEIPSPVNGTVEEILAKVGDKAAVGSPLLRVRSEASSDWACVSPSPGKLTSPTESSSPATGSDKASAPSKPSGSSTPTSASTASLKKSQMVAASPTVRRLAREIGVDVNEVAGSGPRGRVTHDDVKAHSRRLLKKAVTGRASSPFVAGAVGLPVVPLPDFSKFGPISKEPINNIRKKTAEQMALAWSTVPMVTQFDKADVTDLEELRKKMDLKAKKTGGKITVTAILLRIVASALKKFPKFNASLDLVKEEVVFKSYFNVGVAVDTERGLLVPVVKKVDGKNVFELSAELNSMAEKARNRKVTPDDLQGSCFTITNLGGIGGTAFTPIVNPPEVGILGVSRSSVEAVWNGANFEPRQLLPLSLSYDHRLIDGADAARFLRYICEGLENPAMLIFEG